MVRGRNDTKILEIAIRYVTYFLSLEEALEVYEGDVMQNTTYLT